MHDRKRPGSTVSRQPGRTSRRVTPKAEQRPGASSIDELQRLQALGGNRALSRMINRDVASPAIRRFYALSDDQNTAANPEARTGTWWGYPWIDLPDPRDEAEYPARVPGDFLLGWYWSAWPVRNLYARSEAEARAAYEDIGDQDREHDGDVDLELGAGGGHDGVVGEDDVPPLLVEEDDVEADDVELAQVVVQGTVVDEEDRSDDEQEVIRQLPRIMRQGPAGTTFSDLFNALGVTANLLALDFQGEHGTPIGTLGILGGLGVASGGITQVKQSDGPLGTMTGWSNIFSGTFGAVSGILTLAGSAPLADLMARFSMLTWSVAEFISCIQRLEKIANGDGTDRDKLLAALSVVKGIGGIMMTFSYLHFFLLTTGNVLTAAGVLGGMSAGIYKLLKICAEHLGEDAD